MIQTTRETVVEPGEGAMQMTMNITEMEPYCEEPLAPPRAAGWTRHSLSCAPRGARAPRSLRGAARRLRQSGEGWRPAARVAAAPAMRH